MVKSKESVFQPAEFFMCNVNYAQTKTHFLALAEVANCVKYFEGQLYVGGSFDSGVVKLDAATGRFVLTFEGCSF